MRAEGFVLSGGQSSRMGHDKALLPFLGRTLLEHAAGQVLAVTGSATVVGDPDRYARFGYPVIPDRIPGNGPLGGLCTALETTQSEWILLLACDMPAIAPADLSALLLDATSSTHDCMIPRTPDGRIHPLCAAYHRRCLPTMRRALDEKRLAMKNLIAELRAGFTTGIPEARLVNMNTAANWESFCRGD